MLELKEIEPIREFRDSVESKLGSRKSLCTGRGVALAMRLVRRVMMVGRGKFGAASVDVEMNL